jgi:hypothetical protein
MFLRSVCTCYQRTQRHIIENISNIHSYRRENIKVLQQIIFPEEFCSRYSDCLRAARPRVRSSSLGRVKNFLFFTSSRPSLGSTQPPIQWVPGDPSPGVMRPGREADLSPPVSDKVKKMCIYTSTPAYALVA